jgi:multidrug efflux system outer membrane protein
VDEPAFEQADFEAPERLLMKRPDIARAEAELAATHANVEAARKALLPQLRLTGQLAYQYAFRTRFTDLGSEYAYSADGPQLVYSGALVMSQPLFDGGALAGERDAARARRLQAEVNYRRSVVQAISEVERALHELRGLREQVERQHSAVHEAHRAFELIEVEYRAGAEELVAVLDAQRTLFRAEDEFSQLSAAKLRAAATLIAALGAGWSPEHSGARLKVQLNTK